jgi:aminoglycoside phosphotransferase (APT) family kinase protein
VADEVDIEQPAALTEYLRRTGRVAPGEVIDIRVLAGGVSNKTVLVARASSEAWVLKQALPKLRVKVDWFSDPARIGREALALRWLPKLAPECAITSLVFEDPDQHLLAMEAVPQPHENWKTMLLAGRVFPRHVRQFGRLLGTVHRAAFERRDELAPLFDDRSFFESLRVEPYYAYAAAQAPAAAAFYEALIRDTRSTRVTLVHGDYSPKNVLVPRGRRLVLLDHEVIHWGDPAFDLGFALTHALSKANHLAAYRDAFAEAAILFWESYGVALADVPWRQGLEARAARHTLGCLLARVAGRSPLEYLTEPQRGRQQDVVLGLMRAPPVTIASLVEAFVGGVSGK